MVPSVVADFVSLGGNAAHNIGILGGVLANQKERGFDASRFEHVEKPRRENRVRTVIECHGDIRTIDST
jgi:hypothetical protein